MKLFDDRQQPWDDWLRAGHPNDTALRPYLAGHALLKVIYGGFEAFGEGQQLFAKRRQPGARCVARRELASDLHLQFAQPPLNRRLIAGAGSWFRLISN